MQIRVLTMNLWALPWPISRDTEERIRRVCDRLPEFQADVLAFQEVWEDGARERLLEAGEQQGYTESWHHENGDSGLLVLSRLPIRSVEFTPYSLNGFPSRPYHGDYYIKKGFVRLTLETAVGPVDVFNTHLHAKYGGGRRRSEYFGHRMAQIVELAEHLTEIRNPAILLGDFNLHEGSLHYLALSELTGARDCAVTLDQRELTVEYANPYRRRGRRPGRRIDYVFTRDGESRGVSARAIERVFHEPLEIEGERRAYSDHYGLLAVLEVGGPPAAVAPPSDAAIAVATGALELGRFEAEVRLGLQRSVAGGGAVASAIGLAAGARWRPTRRSFLRSLAVGIPGLALLSCAGAAAVSEVFVPEELRRYARAQSKLEGLRSGPVWRDRPSSEAV